MKTRTNVLFGWARVAFGEDECAAAQTVHFNASVPLEWWCATNATADQNVSNTQKTAMCLTIDRINGTHDRVIRLYTENVNKHNQSIDPTTAETDEGSSTVVTVARRDRLAPGKEHFFEALIRHPDRPERDGDQLYKTMVLARVDELKVGIVYQGTGFRAYRSNCLIRRKADEAGLEVKMVGREPIDSLPP